MPDPKSRMEGHRNLKIGRKSIHRWPMTPFRSWKVKVTRPLNAVIENQPYLWKGKTYKLQTWYMNGIQWPASPSHVVTSSVNSHPQWNTKTCIIDMLNDLQACRRRGVLWRLHHRPHRLLLYVNSHAVVNHLMSMAKPVRCHYPIVLRELSLGCIGTCRPRWLAWSRQCRRTSSQWSSIYRL